MPTSTPTRRRSTSTRSTKTKRTGQARTARSRRSASLPRRVGGSQTVRSLAGNDRFAGRRQEIRRQQGARRLRIVLALAAVSLLAVSAIGLVNSEALDVDRVSVTGSARTPTARIVEVSGIRGGQPLLELDLASAERAVQDLPWIRKAQIERGFDGEVTITVEEREPVTALPAAGAFVLVDQLGYQLEKVARPPDGFLPVTGLRASGRPGELAPEEAALVLNLIQALTPSLEPAVAELVVDGGGLTVVLTTGGRANLGDSNLLGEKVQALETVLARVDLKCVSVIDLRVPSAAAVRRSETPEGACR